MFRTLNCIRRDDTAPSLYYGQTFPTKNPFAKKKFPGFIFQLVVGKGETEPDATLSVIPFFHLIALFYNCPKMSSPPRWLTIAHTIKSKYINHGSDLQQN